MSCREGWGVVTFMNIPMYILFVHVGRTVVKLVGREALIREREIEKEVCCLWSLCIINTSDHCLLYVLTATGAEEKSQGRAEKENGGIAGWWKGVSFPDLPQ